MAIYSGVLTLHKQIVITDLVNCNNIFSEMENFGARLKEERKRLGLNQAQFGALAASTNVTQSRYESGERCPDWSYLAAVARAGVDVLYVITGQRDTSQLSADEADLVRRYREAPLPVKAAAVAALTAGAAPAKYQQNFQGATIGQQISDTTIGKLEKLVGIKKKKK